MPPPPPNADTPYGRSKLLAEELIRAAGVRSCILRIAGIFGAYGPSHLGLNRAIHEAIKGIEPTQVGLGSAHRNYIYVRDVAAIIESALAREIEGVHLVAGAEVLSIREMLEQVCEIFIPGGRPKQREGGDAMDQIITHSICLPGSRTFRAALEDIRRSELLCA